jgi:hypothetical protein
MKSLIMTNATRIPAQYFALTVGIIYLLVGIMGFIPGLVDVPAVAPDGVDLGYTAEYGYLLGLFPVNLLHNVVHLLVGGLGILASIAMDSSRLYSGVLALFYGMLTVLGLIPATQSMFGLVPLFGNDVWLHAATAAIAFYFGFIATPDLLQMADPSQQERNPSRQS